MKKDMKQTVEEAAREHQTHFEICDAEGTINGFINGVHKQIYESFISGAEWQSKQSPWKSSGRITGKTRMKKILRPIWKQWEISSLEKKLGKGLRMNLR